MTFDIRTVREDDRSALLTWRNQPRVREVSINDREIDAADHDRWFDTLMASSTDHVLIATVDGGAAGVVSLGEIDRTQRTASWSCHAGPDANPPGFGAALPVLGLGLGFGRFQLRRMYAEVLATNSNMRGIHRRLKLVEEGIRRDAVMRADGTLLDAHEYGVLSTEWAEVRNNVLKMLPRSFRSDLEAVLERLDARS